MKTFNHRFRVAAPLAEVAAFHRRSASMGAITPPPIIVRVQQAPAELAGGDEMSFTLWFGPVPIRWLARIEDVTPNSFSDRQLSGPFAAWVHRHTFIGAGENATDVFDAIAFTPKPGGLVGLVGRVMGLSLPLLFAYRGWKTRRLLERPPRR
jgi:ligand-binding SRPBCC domain-containing protein